MKAETVVSIRKELVHRSPDELVGLCLRLARFKKENKELLTYLLFESEDEEGYISHIKSELDILFGEINTDSYYYMKKSIRKILRLTKKYIRYSLNKETEVELLLYFCEKLRDFKPNIFKNRTLTNLYERQMVLIRKNILKLHEDLQYDYHLRLDNHGN